jgi:hypothetical protein
MHNPPERTSNATEDKAEAHDGEAVENDADHVSTSTH